MAAGRAQIVRQLEFAAIRAFLERGGLQRMVAAAHVALRRRGFSLGDSHAAPSNANNKNCDDLRLISAGPFWGIPAGGGWIVANRGSYSGWRKERKVVGVRFAAPNREDATDRDWHNGQWRLTLRLFGFRHHGED
jgi:hypothetical protein